MKFQRAYGRSTCSKTVRETNLIIPAAHGQLEKTDLGLSDMDSGRLKLPEVEAREALRELGFFKKCWKVKSQKVSYL